MVRHAVDAPIADRPKPDRHAAVRLARLRRMPTVVSRIHALDAMRGLLAIGIMTYHLLGWTHVATITTLGTYGVYAFFVLSGFALEWAYGEHLLAPGGLRRFVAARIARIVPLYAMAALVTAAMTLYARGHVDRSNLVLNVTLAFGFFNPGATSTVVGGWSIGIEAVFYALFPLIVWLRLRTRWLAALAFATLLLRMVYVGDLIPPGTTFGHVWVGYTQIPSFLWFFMAGMVGSRLVSARDAHDSLRAAPGPAAARVRPSSPQRRSWPLVAGLGLMTIVVAASAIGDQRALFVWPIGLVLAVAVAAAVIVTGHSRPWQGRFAQGATLLGDLSYGTYLLHPIVWRALTFAHVGGRTAAVVTFAVAPLLALVVHRGIEVPTGRAIRVKLMPSRPRPQTLQGAPPPDPA
jgi:exopolysaccharide production protein ExoZ